MKIIKNVFIEGLKTTDEMILAMQALEFFENHNSRRFVSEEGFSAAAKFDPYKKGILGKKSYLGSFFVHEEPDRFVVKRTEYRKE